LDKHPIRAWLQKEVAKNLLTKRETKMNTLDGNKSETLLTYFSYFKWSTN